jgi:hypothetical protein
MAGAGYDISASFASTAATPIDSAAPTYFFFQSQADIGPTSQEANPILPATAITTHAEGGSASTSAPGAGSVGSGLGGEAQPAGVSKWVWIIGGASILATIAAAIYIRRK